MAPHSSTLAWTIPWMRSLVGWSPWGCEESDMTERLHFPFSLLCIGEGNGNPLQFLVWRIPGTGEPCGLTSMGSQRVGHDWSDSSNSSSSGSKNQTVLWPLAATIYSRASCGRQLGHGSGKNTAAAAAAAAAKSPQSCLTLCDPIDGSPPGSPIPGILQARTLETQIFSLHFWPIVHPTTISRGRVFRAFLLLGCSPFQNLNIKLTIQIIMKVRKNKFRGTLPNVQSTDSLSSTSRLILDEVYLIHESLALGSLIPKLSLSFIHLS